jgi:hypothetical protein
VKEVCSIKFQIRNGNKIRFWEDNWLEVPLCCAYPNLYQMVENKMSSVEDTLVNGEWIITLRSQPTDDEQQQLTVLRQNLSLITISEQQQDEVIWLRSKFFFTVK